MLMSRILNLPAAVLGGILLAASPGSWAQEYRHHELPAVKDYVVSIEAPTEEIEPHNSTRGRMIGGKGGEYQSASALWRVGDAGAISITIEVYDEEITIEDWLESQQTLLKFTEQNDPNSSLLFKTHDSGYSELMGQRTFYRYTSPKSVFEDGEYRPRNFREPMGKEVMSVFDGRVRVALKFTDHSALMNNAKRMHPALEPALDRSARSIRVRFEELFESFRETEHFTTASNQVSSDPIILASVSMDVPVDWIASDRNSVYPDYENPRRAGRTLVEINHYDPAMFSGAPPRIWVAVEGLEAERPGSSTYQRHARGFLEARVTGARELDSRDVTDELTQNQSRYAHCMSKPGPKHDTASGGITATSYRGKDEQGRDVVALHYHGGGSYVACNYLLTVAPELYAETRAQFEAMLRSLEVGMIGPWNQ